uniref:Metastasis-associated protein MTA3 n=1 Tax=Schistocephalus solidus TaxID=70667 RepID=A0A0X3P402_SCHSO
MSSNNMYRVGDFVFFEASASAPYQIRRIDELNKTPTGAVEAKVTRYYRRRDISSNLIQQAEKYYFQETDSDSQNSPDSNGGGGSNANSLTDIQRHQIKHRELFLSREVECLPATHIRGKCSVTLYNEVEPLTSYVQREDAFYYRLIYDPSTKRLQEDRGSMRIGSDYQSEIQPLLKKGEKDPRFKEKLEELVWDPALSLSPAETDLFISLTKAVGLYARSCDPTNCQPFLLNATATASRDITLQYAHDILFKANYDLKKAMLFLLPDGRPSLCRDELETWTAGEAALFEEALEKYSKFFPDILTDFLPWKTPKSIVELYYFWKTTERYTRHRRNKMTLHEHKLKQVYIPNYSKPNSAVLYNRNDSTDRGCACCHVESSPQWYAWGPPHLMCRLCSGCWTYWKKYGGLKNPDKRDRLDAARGAGTKPVPSTPSAAAATAAPAAVGGTPVVDHRSAPSHHPLPDVSLTSVVYRCTQPGCFKEFRSRDNLITHLSQVHSVLATTISGSVHAAADGNGLTVAVDGASLPAAAVPPTIVPHTHSGTECQITPPLLRLLRILCPEVVRPARLARRPTRPASSTAIAAAAAAAVSDAKALRDCGETVEQMKIAATPKLSKLQDPVSALRRKIAMPPLSVTLKKVLALKSITLPASGDASVQPPASLKRSADCALGSVNGECQALNGKSGDNKDDDEEEEDEADALNVLEAPLPPPEKKRLVELATTNCCSNEAANATTNGNRVHAAATASTTTIDAAVVDKLNSK